MLMIQMIIFSLWGFNKSNDFNIINNNNRNKHEKFSKKVFKVYKLQVASNYCNNMSTSNDILTIILSYCQN
jgi:hypothetical protein